MPTSAVDVRSVEERGISALPATVETAMMAIPSTKDVSSAAMSAVATTSEPSAAVASGSQSPPLQLHAPSPSVASGACSDGSSRNSVNTGSGSSSSSSSSSSHSSSSSDDSDDEREASPRPPTTPEEIPRREGAAGGDSGRGETSAPTSHGAGSVVASVSQGSAATVGDMRKERVALLPTPNIAPQLQRPWGRRGRRARVDNRGARVFRYVPTFEPPPSFPTAVLNLRGDAADHRWRRREARHDGERRRRSNSPVVIVAGVPGLHEGAALVIVAVGRPVV